MFRLRGNNGAAAEPARVCLPLHGKSMPVTRGCRFTCRPGSPVPSAGGPGRLFAGRQGSARARFAQTPCARFLVAGAVCSLGEGSRLASPLLDRSPVGRTGRQDARHVRRLYPLPRMGKDRVVSEAPTVSEIYRRRFRRHDPLGRIAFRSPASAFPAAGIIRNFPRWRFL